ncbi:MAG: XRE family transcriptional regulator [Spirochaetia bacterium]|nr:MAG: XRE family transcriptional regulator [Spirochaetia bacterium]
MKLTAIFARNLRLCRQQCALSQKRLAMFAGLDRSYIGKLERELSSPTLDVVEALSSAMQIDVEVLIRRQPPEAKKRS